MTTAQKTLKMGIVGIGVGAAEILPAMESFPTIEMVAGADVNKRVLQTFHDRYGCRTYGSIEELCKDPEVEGVWISTPNKFHAQHSIIAAEHGKHVVVEKPMAVSLEEADKMIEAAERNNVKLLCGHTQSFGAPIRAMRRVINSGELGKLCALNVWAYTDWMLRPRTAEELDPTQGGGVPFRQGPHQIDTIRLLGGGMVRSVRGMTGQWLRERPIAGFYEAYLEFEDGTPAFVLHDGYGYFLTSELVQWGSDRSRYTSEERINIRKALRTGHLDETEAKDAMRIGGSQEQQIFRRDGGRRPWVPNDLGILVASCERGDMRQSQWGIFVYDDNGVRELEVDQGAAQRRAELEEFYNAVVLNKPIYHTGPWGMATLEVCLAIIDSARERREIMLSHQVPAPADYD